MKGKRIRRHLRRRLAAPALILCLLLLWAVPALAADGDEKVQKTPVTLTVTAEEADLNGMTVKLYKTAEFSSDGQYQLLAPYASYLGGRDFDGSDSGKLEGGAQTLEAYVRADDRKPDAEASIRNGMAQFTDIPAGLYLILYDVPEQSPYMVGAQLQSLPYDFQNGGYVSSVTLLVKAVSKPVPEKTSYKVQKLWQGDAKTDRPSEITVTILKDGDVYDTVSLNADNNWSYSWEAESGTFLVKEDSVPDGYTVQTSSDGTTFQITNTRQHETQTPAKTTTPGASESTTVQTPDTTVQPTTGGSSGTVSTGDHSRIYGWLFLMCASGLALVLAGWRLARR